MTTPISATGAVAGSQPVTPARSGTDAMGSDAFLQLLVAQLKYQDPTNPTDSTQFLAQTAQFQMVEKLEELTKQNTAMSQAQGAMQAASLLGRYVTYTKDGTDHVGQVTATHLYSDGPTVSVDGAEVPLEAVTQIALSRTP